MRGWRADVHQGPSKVCSLKAEYIAAVLTSMSSVHITLAKAGGPYSGSLGLEW
jgi:hypothetical protein